MDIKDRQIIPTGALVIVMHTCEFPDGNRWGVKIAKAAVDTLGSYDEFGVLYYGPQGEQWRVPLARVSDRVRIKSIISGLQAGDMPSFDSTLRMADAALAKSRASVKHIIIISDGDPQPPQTSFLQAITAKGITISTVAVFPARRLLLEDPREHRQGRQGPLLLSLASADELPQIFIKEARTVRRGLLCEEAFTPAMVLDTVPVTGFQAKAISRRSWATSSRRPSPSPRLPLVTHNKDPLLAHWQYGLGRTVAFTSDAKAKWAANWVGWGNYAGSGARWSNGSSARSRIATSPPPAPSAATSRP